MVQSIDGARYGSSDWPRLEFGRVPKRNCESFFSRSIYSRNISSSSKYKFLECLHRDFRVVISLADELIQAQSEYESHTPRNTEQL